MSEKRATSSGGYTPTRQPEPRAGDSVAKLGDHLGRLLAQADKLLAEWQAHAEGMRGRFEREAESAGSILAARLEAALAEAARQTSVELQSGFGANAEALRADLERARQAAADLEAHMKRIAGGARATSVDELRQGIQGISAQLRAFSPESRGASMTLVVLGVAANLMLAVVIFMLTRRPATEPAPQLPLPEPPTPIVLAAPDAGPPPPRPQAAPCAAVPVEGVATAARLAQACAVLLCNPPTKLAECRRDGAAGDLVAALRALERDKALAKLGCPLPEKDADGRYPVTVRWLLDCPSSR